MVMRSSTTVSLALAVLAGCGALTSAMPAALDSYAFECHQCHRAAAALAASELETLRAVVEQGDCVPDLGARADSVCNAALEAFSTSAPDAGDDREKEELFDREVGARERTEQTERSLTDANADADANANARGRRREKRSSARVARSQTRVLTTNAPGGARAGGCVCALARSGRRARARRRHAAAPALRAPAHQPPREGAPQVGVFLPPCRTAERAPPHAAAHAHARARHTPPPPCRRPRARARRTAPDRGVCASTPCL